MSTAIIAIFVAVMVFRQTKAAELTTKLDGNSGRRAADHFNKMYALEMDKFKHEMLVSQKLYDLETKKSEHENQLEMERAEHNREMGRLQRNNDLFDKRFGVYEAARKIIQHTFNGPEMKAEDIEEYRMAILDSVFLFGEELETYLFGIWSEVRHHYHHKKRLLKMDINTHIAQTEGGVDRDELVDKILAIEDRMEEELDNGILKERFKPYLQLD